jgi:hypothetical protein
MQKKKRKESPNQNKSLKLLSLWQERRERDLHFEGTFF